MVGYEHLAEEIYNEVDEFLSEVINPVLEENKDILGMTAEINV